MKRIHMHHHKVLELTENVSWREKTIEWKMGNNFLGMSGANVFGIFFVYNVNVKEIRRIYSCNVTISDCA